VITIDDSKPPKTTKRAESKHIIERNLKINDTHIRVKSVFGNIPLEKALANIAKRRLAELKQSNKP